MSLAKRVKAILNRTEETKYVSETILDGRSATYTNFNSTIGTVADWYRCIPQLAQGSTEQTWVRDGAEVSPMKVNVHWEFRFGNTDNNTRDIFVVLYVVQPVAQKTYGAAAVNGSISYPGQFLITGAGGATYPNQQGFAGVPLDITRPIYKKSFKLLHKKVFRLSKPSGSSNGSGVIGQYDGTGDGQYSNGSDSKRHSWTFKQCPKVLKYNESSGTTFPTNACPYWAAGYYYADGTAADTAGGILNISCRAEMTFKDD